jgi:hypothetical protein
LGRSDATAILAVTANQVRSRQKDTGPRAASRLRLAERVEAEATEEGEEGVVVVPVPRCRSAVDRAAEAVLVVAALVVAEAVVVVAVLSAPTSLVVRPMRFSISAPSSRVLVATEETEERPVACSKA